MTVTHEISKDGLSIIFRCDQCGTEALVPRQLVPEDFEFPCTCKKDNE